MGWTHYWNRESELPLDKFSDVTFDCRKVLESLDIPLAGIEGSGSPKITDDEILFNGIANAGCEPFDFKRIQLAKPGGDAVFDYCKTEHMPYDLAVQCCLVILKFHLGKLITVSSDGKEEDWEKAKSIIQEILGVKINTILSVS